MKPKPGPKQDQALSSSLYFGEIPQILKFFLDLIPLSVEVWF